MKIEIRRLTPRYPYDQNCRVIGLTAEKLISTMMRSSSDDWEHCSVIPHLMGEITVWWCYREIPDSLGRACACSRQSASSVEINLVSVRGFDTATCLQQSSALELV